MTTSPDFSRYVDLSIYDTDAETILNDIISYARGVLPQWSPLAGEVEVVLAEAIAASSANMASYINRLPNATSEILMRLFGVTRSDGTAATGVVQFTMVDTSGYTVPAGTSIAYVAVNSVAYVYKTTSDLTVPNGNDTGSVTVEAVAVGTGYNSATTSSNLSMLSNNRFVSSVVFTTAPSGGANPETDQDFFDRASNLFTTYSSALVQDSQIQAFVLSNFPTVAYRVRSFDQRRYRDRDISADSYTSHPGYVLLAVGSQNASQSDYSDITVSPSGLASVRSSVESKLPTGVVLDIMSAEVVSVEVSANVVAAQGYDTGVVEASVRKALNDYLDPNVWDWSKQYVRNNELIALIDGVEGVDYVRTVTTNGFSEIGSNNFTNVEEGVRLNNLGTLVGSRPHNVSATQ